MTVVGESPSSQLGIRGDVQHPAHRPVSESLTHRRLDSRQYRGSLPRRKVERSVRSDAPHGVRCLTRAKYSDALRNISLPCRHSLIPRSSAAAFPLCCQSWMRSIQLLTTETNVRQRALAPSAPRVCEPPVNVPFQSLQWRSLVSIFGASRKPEVVHPAERGFDSCRILAQDFCSAVPQTSNSSSVAWRSSCGTAAPQTAKGWTRAILAATC